MARDEVNYPRRHLTEAAVRLRLGKALVMGASYRAAAAGAAVAYREMRQLMRSDRDFGNFVADARGRGELRRLARFDAGDWRAAAWVLERRYPRHYGPVKPSDRAAAPAPKGGQALSEKDQESRRLLRMFIAEDEAAENGHPADAGTGDSWREG